jgi:RND family efflux transporter MFP subunit
MNRKIAIALLAALMSGCAREEKKAEAASAKEAEPLEIRVARAELRQVDRAIPVTGSLHPDEAANVSAEVAGRVAAVLVDFGQSVRKGQVLVELDRSELQFQLERAQASLAQALARLGLEPGAENTRPESTPGIKQALAQMEDARSRFENARALVKTGDISQERFTELEKAYQARMAALEAARDEVRTQSAGVQGLRAEVKLAQKRLADATVRAPFDGAVSERQVSPGQYVKENTPMLTVIKTHPMRLRLEIPESAAGAIRIGTSLTFTTDATPGAELTANVRELNPSLDAKSRSLTAEARLTTSDSRLRPGMFVQVQLVVSRKQDVVVVPKQALYTLAGLTKLFVVEDGKAIERKITPGRDMGDWVEVPADAVKAGQSVATTQLGQLAEGAPVKIRS